MRTAHPILRGLLCGLLLAAAGSAAAQSRPMPLRGRPVDTGPHPLWVLHVQFAAPEDLIGAGIHYVPKEGWGGYGSIWLSTTNIAEDAFYYETLQPEDIERLGGERLGREDQWGGGRFGLTRRLGRQTYAYGGVGLMRGRHYVEYRFEPPLAAPDRTLWVDDQPRDSMKGVVEIGFVFYTEGGIAFSLGLGTDPAGVSFGMGFGTKL